MHLLPMQLDTSMLGKRMLLGEFRKQNLHIHEASLLLLRRYRHHLRRLAGDRTGSGVPSDLSLVPRWLRVLEPTGMWLPSMRLLHRDIGGRASLDGVMQQRYEALRYAGSNDRMRDQRGTVPGLRFQVQDHPLRKELCSATGLTRLSRAGVRFERRE